MEILFTGSVPKQKIYSYAVRGNYNSNTITFVLDKIQEDNLDLSSLTCFAKIQGYALDKDIVEKVVEGDKLKIKWIMKRKHTKSRIISVQLQFEGYQNDCIWQTEIIEITLSGIIKADEYIEDNYPGELANHERRIQNLEVKGDIKKIIELELTKAIEVNPDIDEVYRLDGTRVIYRNDAAGTDDDLDAPYQFMRNLHIKLINFNQSDVGKYIYLFRKSQTSNKGTHQKKSYVHPSNFDSENKKIQKLGYAFFAGHKNFGKIMPEAPSWMPHGGAMQTEFLITQEDINRGYIEVDLSNELLSMLLYYNANTKEKEFGLYSNIEETIIGVNQTIKYALVNNNNIEFISYQKLFIGGRNRYDEFHKWIGKLLYTVYKHNGVYKISFVNIFKEESNNQSVYVSID